MRRRLLCVLCSLCVLCATAAAAAVADYLGRPVGSVRLVIEGRDSTEPLMMQIVGTASGQPLSMVQVRETVAHLFSLGRFEGVSVDATIEFDFFHAARLLQTRFADPWARIGASLSPAQDPVRFAQAPSLAFPSSTLDRGHSACSGDSVRLRYGDALRATEPRRTR